MQLGTLERRVRGLEQRRTPAVVVPSALDLFRAAWGEPDPWQVAALSSSAPSVLLNCSRQSGKSTVAATLATHTALAVPGSLTLVLSPTLRQSQEVYRKCLAVYQAAGRPIPPDAENSLTLELSSGSRIVNLPGSEATVRGYSAVSLLIIDEAARVADEVYFAIRPTLAVSGGRLFGMSTPFGLRGWWSAAWHSTEAWQRFEVSAEQVPRIPPAFLAEERAALGVFYGQEYECSFLDTQFQLYATADIDRAVSHDVKPLFGSSNAELLYRA
jgi:hypothetical protein